MKTGLVMEGGALRTIFSCGVCDAFLDADLPMPDFFVGVSGGIAYGASFLTRQNRRNLKLLTTYANDTRYMSWRNMADRHNKSFFGLKFAYETIPNQLLPFDYEAFEAYPGTVEAVLTNLETGKAEYWDVPRTDRTNLVTRASCSIPLMFPIATVEGKPYLDGGCADAIPWKRAFDAGCDRVVVLLTRERAYRKEDDKTMKVIEQTFRKYPAFVETMRRRADNYNRSRDELFALEAEGKVLVIAPEDTLGCRRTERDAEVLRGLWQQGYFIGRQRAEEVRTLWTP